MESKSAQSAFEEFLARGNLELSALTPSAGVDVMLSFYRDIRAEGCPLDKDADMLLFQWGTYGWGGPEFFEFDITRQLIFGGEAEDENIWQLSLTFKFPPTAPLRALGSGNRWCNSPEHLAGLDVGDDGGTGMGLQNVAGEQQHQLIAPQHPPLPVDRADAVAVAVEGDAQVATVFAHAGL